MVENKGTDLTEQETELYDRQIRLWGLESQKRLRSARILLCGLNGLGAEVAKNLILAGIKSITLLDHRNVSASDFCSQFLAPQTSLNENRADASLLRAQALNPMVEISVDKENLAKKPKEYFANFDVVVVIGEPISVQISVNNACREQGVKFFCGDVWGMFGYSFADLQEHKFAEEVFKHKLISDPKSTGKPKTELISQTVEKTLKFPSLQDTINFNCQTAEFKKRIKRTGPSYFLLKILQQFREKHERDPSYELRENDLIELHKIRDELANGLVSDTALVHVFAQIAPATAIVGGELAQEVIKTVSNHEAPHRNIFLFDPETCCGYVEAISIE